MSNRARRIGLWITAAALTLIAGMGVIAVATPDAPDAQVNPASQMQCWDEWNPVQNDYESIYGPLSAAPEGARNFRPTCA
jgi:hypothetical protein